VCINSILSRAVFLLYCLLADWQVTIKGCTGPVNTFVVEPFVLHKEEYYLCIQV
jgi:hypothetical protein